MAKITFSDIQAYISKHPWLGKWVVNKYTITTLLFGVFFLFVGDQCIVKQVKRVRQERHLHDFGQHRGRDIWISAFD